jgi:hypothetical protein
LHVGGAELFSGQEATESNVGSENSVMSEGKVNDLDLGKVSGGEEQENLGQYWKIDLLSRILKMMEEERKARERSRP